MMSTQQNTIVVGATGAGKLPAIKSCWRCAFGEFLTALSWAK
jgi:hypothetical protein